MSAVVKTLQVTSRNHISALKMHSPPPLNHLRMLALELERGKADVAPFDEGELQQTWLQVQAWLSSDQHAKTLPLDVWKIVPALLWWPHEGQQAAEYRRLREGVAWAASMSVPRTSWVESLASAYAEASDAKEESRRWLGNTLRQWCGETLDDRLNVWRSRDRDWELFSPSDFYVKMSGKLQRSPDMSVRSALLDAGFLNARAQSADLSRQAFLAHLKFAIHAAQGYDLLHLERIREWKDLVLGESAAWHKDFSAAVINGLLEPWASFNPPEVEFQKNVQRTLEGWFGPVPDRWTGHWNGASPLSREILARWKILDVMEAFFQRVEDYARRLEKRSGNDEMRRHWRYRRPFWLAYYKKGVVTRARALIGRGMIDEFGEDKLRGQFGKAMARLDSKASKHHCGLLLEINGLLVIDLSHNGKAYFYLPSNEALPSPLARSYDRDKIDATADTELIHQGSETYVWQAKFADFINDQTRVRLKPRDYSLQS
jgi:hypothetical protein